MVRLCVPLVSDPEASDTAGLSRDHVVNISDSGLLTIAGGKWTSYRKMSLDAVNEAVKLGNLNPERESQTETTMLVGAEKVYETQKLASSSRSSTWLPTLRNTSTAPTATERRNVASLSDQWPR